MLENMSGYNMPRWESPEADRSSALHGIAFCVRRSTSTVVFTPVGFHMLPFSSLCRTCGVDFAADGGTSTSWLSHGFLSFTSSAWTTLALSLPWSGGPSESFSRYSDFTNAIVHQLPMFLALWLALFIMFMSLLDQLACLESLAAPRTVAIGKKWFRQMLGCLAQDALPRWGCRW